MPNQLSPWHDTLCACVWLLYRTHGIVLYVSTVYIITVLDNYKIKFDLDSMLLIDANYISCSLFLLIVFFDNIDFASSKACSSIKGEMSSAEHQEYDSIGAYLSVEALLQIGYCVVRAWYMYLVKEFMISFSSTNAPLKNCLQAAAQRKC